MTRAGELRVETPRCIGCGACHALSPSAFGLLDGASRVLDPRARAEESFVEAARWVCPTDAIRGSTGEVSGAASSPGPRFLELAIGAERVRWSLESLPWHDLDPLRATPALRSLVREMAVSESATYSATQRFMEAFFDDLELSKWISVWFYEETRHPHVLIEWLRRVGDDVPADVEVSGRVSTPRQAKGGTRREALRARHQPGEPRVRRSVRSYNPQCAKVTTVHPS